MSSSNIMQRESKFFGENFCFTKVVKILRIFTDPSWTATVSSEDAENHALFAGYQADGSKVYVGKISDNGNEIPAKILPSLKSSLYENSGNELSTNQIEYLLHSDGYEWLKSSDGNIVPDAVTVSNFYVGRAVHNGNTVIGRVDLESKQLIASFEGNALYLPNYDVLVFKPTGIIFSFFLKFAESYQVFFFFFFNRRQPVATSCCVFEYFFGKAGIKIIYLPFGKIKHDPKGNIIFSTKIF